MIALAAIGTGIMDSQIDDGVKAIGNLLRELLCQNQSRGFA